MMGETLEVKTSESHPIRVDWLPVDLPGRVGLTFAPGKKYRAVHTGGQWERDLHVDLDRLVAEFGMQVLVSLLENQELDRLGIPDLFDEVRRRGVELHRHPIPDLHIPSDFDAVRSTVHLIGTRAREGKTVVIHCAGGIGRTGVIAGCFLVDQGLAPTQALDLLARVRDLRCPETDQQREYIRRYAKGTGGLR